jgi:hypothetical protein
MSMILLVFFLLPFNGFAAESIDYMGLLPKAAKACDSVHDYTSTFYKKELINGKMNEGKAILRFKRPKYIYTHWLEGDLEGVEAVYIEGQNNNKINVHKKGILGFIKMSVDPFGSMAMKGNRHPITQAGLAYLIDESMRNRLLGLKNGDAVFTYEGVKVVNGHHTDVVKSVYPKDKGYYCHISYHYYDRATSLPIKLTNYGWNNELLEEYIYDDLKTNVDLTEKDFVLN